MITRTAKRLLGLTNHSLKFTFCMNKALLDPSKHTTMNHSPHNMFVDLYDIGQYPEVVLPASIAPRTYQSVVVSTAVDVLNTKYGTNLTVQDFNNNLQKPWQRFIQKNLKSNASVYQVLSPILNKLALNIYVRQSRWTWVKQQRQRLNATATHFQVNTPQTLGQFLEQYNALIEQLVLASSLGLSPHIPQAATPLQKHYVQQMSDSQHFGVEQLNRLQPQNNNFINRIMGLIHRI